MNYCVYVDACAAKAELALLARLTKYNQRVDGIKIIEIRENPCGNKCRVIFDYSA